jgi:hypothetical protein
VCFRKGRTQPSGEAKIERLDCLKASFWLFSIIGLVIFPTHQELLVLRAIVVRYSTSSGVGRKTVLLTLVGHRHTLVLDKRRSGPKYLLDSLQLEFLSPQL